MRIVRDTNCSASGGHTICLHKKSWWKLLGIAHSRLWQDGRIVDGVEEQNVRSGQSGLE